VQAKGEPFHIAARAVRGYRGPPADFYDFRVCLMSERMVRVLRGVGVDNIQTYPAFLVEGRTATRKRPLAHRAFLGADEALFRRVG
jgi:hypothetical protein